MNSYSFNSYSSVYAPTTFNLTESPYLQPGETCSTLALAAPGFPTGCRVWRSCRSCLQKIGCMVNPMGLCASQKDPMGGYNPGMDYRVAFAQNVTVTGASISDPQLSRRQSWQFPAIETKYCAVDDATCVQCKQAAFYLPSSSAIDSRFCVGAGGCVCVFSCEYLTSSALLAECSASPTPTPEWSQIPPQGPFLDSIGEMSESTKTAIFAIPCIIVLVLTVLVIKFNRNHRARQRRGEPRVHRTQAARQLPRSNAMGMSGITLSGWNQHREQLIANENLRLAGAGDVVTAAYEQLRSPEGPTDSTPPSART